MIAIFQIGTDWTLHAVLGREQREAALRDEIAEQSARRDTARQKLAGKVTKAAQESVRIATKKIQIAQDKLDEMRHREPRGTDARFYPGQYVPVIVMEGGKRVLKPMRYQCRPAGVPADFDRRFPGTYNARLDSLGGYWRELFGHTHGLVVVSAFFEHVKQHAKEGRELAPGEQPTNLVLEFKPQPLVDLLLACVWSRWTAPGLPDLLSFAIITDDPPPEVLAAGHDRCVIPIMSENIDAWLSPDATRLELSRAVLQDRVRPYYAHQTIG